MNKEFSIAPMLDWTDKYFRYFMRMMCPKTLLYSEMISTEALLFGQKEKLLSFFEKETPVALQLGGSETHKMAECGRMGEKAGYAEININAGCPSERVENGHFGAVLMKDPVHLAEMVASLKENVSVPISVKTRISLESEDNPFDNLYERCRLLQKAGVDKVIIHARLARLKKGFSPEDNRKKMALDYESVYRLKQLFPDLPIIINGDIKTINDIRRHTEKTDGVMIGREAYKNPYQTAQNINFFTGYETPTRKQILKEMILLIEKENPARILYISRHMMSLYKGTPFASIYKKALMENSLSAMTHFYEEIPDNL